MKTCYICKLSLPLSEFYYTKTTGAYHSWCKGCHKIRRDANYANNRERILVNQRRRRKESPELHLASLASGRDRAQRFIWSYLKEHPCVDCGVADPVVLEFDHLKDKEQNISKLVAGRATQARLMGEIDKCEVVCANCHRRRTYTRANVWRINAEHDPSYV